MLTGLKIGNFKAFGETQTVPIKPITLIFGANSSGKSSIIHALLLARQLWQGENAAASKNQVVGDCVDLGSFLEFAHNFDASREVTLSLAFDLRDTVEGSPRLRTVSGEGHVTVLFRICPAQSEGAPGNSESLGRTTLIEVGVGGEPLVRLSQTTGQPLRFDRIYWSLAHRVNEVCGFIEQQQRQPEMQEDEEHAKMAAQSKSQTELLLERLRGYPIHSGSSLFGVQSSKEDRSVRSKLKEVFAESMDMGEPPPEEVQELLAEHSWAKALVFDLEDFLEELSTCLPPLQHVGPLRWHPPRHFIQSHGESGGGQAWDAIFDESELREKVNKFLKAMGMPYCVSIRQLVDLRTQQLSFSELKLLDDQERMLSVRDVGMGVNQVIPVVVLAASAKGSMALVEQPELHLHPAQQAELGDVFIESALGDRKNTFILETHSEHLILRIMRRIRETSTGKLPAGIPPVRPSDVTVLYVEKDGPQSIVREFPLNERGELVKAWPGGFFEEGYRELFS